MSRKGAVILIAFVFLFCPLFAQLKYANILFEEQSYREAIPLYERVLEKKGDNIEVIEKLAYCYKVINDYENAEKYFAMAVESEKADASSYLYYGQLLKNANKINQAKAQFIKFSEKKPGSLIGKLMINSCENIMEWSSQPVEYKITNLKEINSSYNDIGPFPYKNGLVFTSEKNHLQVEKPKKKNKEEEIPNFSLYYVPYDDQQQAGKIELLFSKVSGEDYEGPAYFNRTEDEVYFNKVFDTRRFLVNQIKIFHSRYQNGAWNAPKPFPLNSNEYTVTNPVLSFSGDTIFFASDKEGGYGGMDIYYCIKRGDSEWSKAVNLGPLINTEGFEIPSFYDSKGTLFFSSNFHPGYGGFDVFSTTWNGSNWSSPKNLKSPLNSTKDELGYITFNGEEGYFSSNRDGGLGKDDIYRFSLMDTADFSNYTSVSGIFEYKNLPLENVTLNLLDENDVLIQSAVTNAKGEFKFKGIPPNTNYQIIVDEPDDRVPEGAKLYLTNSKNEKVKLLSQIRKGLFKFEALEIDKYDDLPLLEEEDETLQRLTVLGEVYNKISGDLPANMEIYLLDDSSNVISTATTDGEGKFRFEDLKLSEEFLFRLSKKDPNLELNILNEQYELIAATTRNENGDFVYLTNLQKSVKNPDVAGVFRYGKLPASDVDLDLLNARDEVIQHTKTDSKGEFVFRNLQAGEEYAIKVDETKGKVPKNASMFLHDRETGRLLPVARSGKGTFNFKTLAYDEPEEMALLEVKDDEGPKITLLGEVYNKLSMDVPEDMKVYLMDDEGNIIATATTGKDGRFSFENVTQKDEFLFRLSENDPNLELKIINQHGQLIGTTSRNETGDFVYLTNLQKAVKNPDVAGVFQYGKLPASDVALQLMDEKDEILQRTKTDSKGEFSFKGLQAGKNYAVKVDPAQGEVPANAEMFLRDRHTGRLLPVAKSGNGTFNFQTLAYDEPEEMALLEVKDDEGPKITLLGEVYNKLSMDVPEDMKVYLMDDDGNIIATATTGKDGRFSFENVTQKDEFLFRLSENDPNLELKIINQHGQLIGTTSRNETGDFVYLTNLQKAVKNPDVAGVFQYGKLPASDVALQLMDEKDEVLQRTKTDSKGEFSFNGLQAGKSYAVKVDPAHGEVPANAEMFLRDRHTGRLLPVAKSGNGTFNFQTLAYDEPEEMTLLEVKDEAPATSERFFRKIDYNKLPMDLPEGMVLFLTDDEGQVISRCTVGKNGRYRFDKLEMDEAQLVLMLEKDAKMNLKIVDKNGRVIANLAKNEKGELVYERPSQKSTTPEQTSGKSPKESKTTIYYEFSSWELSAEAIRALDQIINTLNSDQNLKLVVNTHTDSRGDEKYNIWLGNRRARGIVQYLSVEGVDANRVRFVSYGESRLVNDCDDDTRCPDHDHAQNRRAEFEFVKQ